jgi:hypothetical protein
MSKSRPSAFSALIISKYLSGGRAEFHENGVYGHLLSVGGPEEMVKVILQKLNIHHDKKLLRSKASHLLCNITQPKYLNALFSD